MLVKFMRPSCPPKSLVLLLTCAPLRCPVQQLLPSVPPAPAQAAGETPLHGAALAQQLGPDRGAPGALLCGLPQVRNRCVDSSLQRV